MKFRILVKPNARKNEVKRTDEGMLVISVAVPPVEGKANEKVIELLSDYLRRPKRSISIIAGHKGKIKTIRVEQ